MRSPRQREHVAHICDARLVSARAVSHGVREALVGLAGIDRSTPDTFAVVAQGDDEVLLGSDAGHLDFRASVRREPGRIVLTTVVQLHNWRGRAYFAPIRPVHPFAVRAVLNRAAFRLARSAEVRPAAPATAADLHLP